eukprot:1140148-Pelagomonas_calceolata.AAC.1
MGIWRVVGNAPGRLDSPPPNLHRNVPTGSSPLTPRRPLKIKSTCDVNNNWGSLDGMGAHLDPNSACHTNQDDKQDCLVALCSSSKKERFTPAVRPRALRKEPPNDSHQLRASVSTRATRNRSRDLLANALLAFRPGFRNMMVKIPPQGRDSRGRKGCPLSVGVIGRLFP